MISFRSKLAVRLDDGVTALTTGETPFRHKAVFSA